MPSNRPRTRRMRISDTNFRPSIVEGAPESKASQDYPAGSSASVRVPGAREDIYQKRTLSNGARARVPEMQGSNVVDSESLDGMASRSFAILEHDEIRVRALATRTHGRRCLSVADAVKGEADLGSSTAPEDRGEATSKLMDEQSIFLLPAQPEGSQGIKRKRTH